MKPLTPVVRFGWELIQWIGVLFTFVGAVSLFLPLFPLRVGETQWEFGAVSAFLDTIPIFGLGLGFLLASGLALGIKWQVRGAALGCGLLAFLIWMAAGLYATVVPQALGSTGDFATLTLIKKSIAKAGVQILIYPVGFLWLGFWGLRRTFPHRPGE